MVCCSCSPTIAIATDSYIAINVKEFNVVYEIVNVEPRVAVKARDAKRIGEERGVEKATTEGKDTDQGRFEVRSIHVSTPTSHSHSIGETNRHMHQNDRRWSIDRSVHG